MSYEIAHTKLFGNQEIGVFQDGRLTEYYLIPTEKKISVGDIYRGKVSKILPGLQAAFVDIGTEQGFLHVDDAIPNKYDCDINKDIRTLLKVGQEILVQVIKEGIEHKKPRLSRKISLSGEYLVLLPNTDEVHISKKIEADSAVLLEKLQRIHRSENHGLILRSKAADVQQEILQQEYESLAIAWRKAEQMIPGKVGLLYTKSDFLTNLQQDIGHKQIRTLWTNDEETYQKYRHTQSCKLVTIDDLEGHYNLRAQLKSALQKKVPFGNGGYLVIDETEAMVVIDVNSGKFTARDAEKTYVKINEQAAKEIAHQIILRNLSGIIIIDFIDMQEQEHYDHVAQVMKDELVKDRRKNTLVGWSNLSLMELTRQKNGLSLSRCLEQNCTYCNKGKCEHIDLTLWNILLAIHQLYTRDSQRPILLECNHNIEERIAQENELLEHVNLSVALSHDIKWRVRYL